MSAPCGWRHWAFCGPFVVLAAQWADLSGLDFKGLTLHTADIIFATNAPHAEAQLDEFLLISAYWVFPLVLEFVLLLIVAAAMLTIATAAALILWGATSPASKGRILSHKAADDMGQGGVSSWKMPSLAGHAGARQCRISVALTPV